MDSSYLIYIQIDIQKAIGDHNDSSIEGLKNCVLQCTEVILKYNLEYEYDKYNASFLIQHRDIADAIETSISIINDTEIDVCVFISQSSDTNTFNVEKNKFLSNINSGKLNHDNSIYLTKGIKDENHIANFTYQEKHGFYLISLNNLENSFHQGN